MASTPLEQMQAYNQLLEQEKQQMQVRNADMQNQYSQVTQGGGAMQGGSIVQIQLDLNETIERIHHLLAGHVLKINPDGHEVWEEPNDDRLKIFSDYGIKAIMNMLSFYVNPNTLLSYYDEETIKWTVRDFGIELTDLILCRYEFIFSYPSVEELYDRYLPIVRQQKLNITEEQLYFKCEKWSAEELQGKVRHFPIVCQAIINTVHTTYRRALGGKERESLRKMMHVSQSTSQSLMPTQPQGGVKILGMRFGGAKP